MTKHGLLVVVDTVAVVLTVGLMSGLLLVSGMQIPQTPGQRALISVKSQRAESIKLQNASSGLKQTGLVVFTCGTLHNPHLNGQ
jgi:hypothetical protein